MAIGDENVTIRINVKADTAAIDRVRQKLRQLCREADDCADTFDKYSAAVDNSSESQKKLHRDSNETEKRLKSVGREANGLSKILKTSYKFAFIAAGIETAALALALSSVNGLLATGRFLVKSYHVAMSAMAKAAAAAGVALATVAAAQRQYVAAQATARYGGSYAAASQGLRILTGDAQLAALGMKTLTGAFQAASKNAPVTGATARALSGLLDFAVLSGDIEKGTAALANFVSLVQKGGAGGKGVAEAAAELGPEFQKAFAQISRGGRATSQDLMKAFASGQLAQQAGIAGSYGAIQGTLVGQFRAFTTQAQVMFGDLGMAFIVPVQKAFAQLTQILKRTIIQISPLLNEFAQGGLLDKVVNGTDKVAQFLVTLMRDYVPKTQGFFEAMARGWDRITGAFDRFGKYLRQFTEASRLMNRFFGQIFGAIGKGLRENFEAFATLIVDNRQDFDNFGKSIANLLTSIFKLTGAIREAFMKALPVINRIIDSVATLVNLVATLISSLAGLGGAGIGGSLALALPMLAGFGGKGRGGKKGLGKMTTGNKLALGGGALAVGGLGQIPGIGGDLGSMASAAMLAAMFAPTTAAGSFAPAAALAAAGYVGTDILTDRTYREGLFGTGIGAKNKAVSAGTGAAAGTAIGATVGSILPGPGTAVGAIAGAIIGGIIGGVSGWMKEGKYKKQARDAAKTFVDGYASAVEDVIGRNDIETATRALAGFEYQMKEMAKTQVKSGTAEKKAMELWQARSKELEGTIKVMEGRFGDLNTITGMSNEQIQNLANAAEINLGNSMLSLKDILNATGIAVERLGEDFDQYLTDTFATDIGLIQNQVDVLKAPSVKNELAQAFIDAIKGGVAGAGEFGQMLEGILTQNQLLFGPAGADLAMLGMFGRGATFGQGAAFQAGGVFGARGITPEMITPEMRQVYEAYMGGRQQSYAAGAAQNLVQQLAGQGMMPKGMTVEGLTSLFASGNVPLDRLIQFSQRLSQGSQFTSEFGVQAGGRQGGGGPSLESQVGTLLKEFGIDLGTNIELEKTNDQKMLEGITKFYNGTGTFTSDTAKFSAAVDKFALSVGTARDTASPRRNIVGTLGAHSMIDGGIAGNRTVTSGLRSWGLGSMSSDHAAGRAYDLVGQNLGLYQMAIKANGGYAEFHGGSSQRHLHVVPNVNGPVGDTAMPVIANPAMAAASSSTTSVNMTINAAPGMDVNALASEIMYRIERETRSRQERY